MFFACKKLNSAQAMPENSFIRFFIYQYQSVFHKHHYWKPALCRVPEALPSVFYRALGKDGFAECFFSALGKDGFAECFFFGTRQTCILPSTIFRHSAKCVFAECLFSSTRQRCILPSALFWHSAKCILAECLCFGTR